MCLHYFRLWFIILLIVFINSACISTELVREERVVGSDRVAQYTGDFSVEVVTAPNLSDLATIRVRETANIEYDQRVVKKKSIEGVQGVMFGGLIVFVGALLLEAGLEDGKDPTALRIIQGAGAITSLLPLLFIPREPEQTEIEKRTTYNSVIPEKQNIYTSDKPKRLNHGEVTIDLFKDADILTSHHRNKPIKITYKNKSQSVLVDLTERHLNPSLNRLSEYRKDVQRFRERKDLWIGNYVDNGIERLKAPRKDSETETEYFERLEQAENSKPQIRERAEIAFNEEINKLMEPYNSERKHIIRQLSEPFTASPRNTNYNLDSGLLELDLIFENTLTPSYSIRSELNRDDAKNIVPELRAREAGATIHFELSESDELLIKDILLDDKNGFTIELSSFEHI